MLALKTYAHAMREEEGDLGFADFASPDGPRRPHTALHIDGEDDNEDAPSLTDRGRLESLEHETGLEPATPTLATWRSTN